MASPDVLPLSSFHRLGLEAHLLRSIMSTVSSGAGGGAGKAIRDVAQEVTHALPLISLSPVSLTSQIDRNLVQDPLTSGYQLYSISKKFVFEKGGFVEKAVEDTHGIAIKTDYFAKVSEHTHVIAGTLLRHLLTPCLYVCVSCLVLSVAGRGALRLQVAGDPHRREVRQVRPAADPPPPLLQVQGQALLQRGVPGA
jgi:hypothetical protein